MRDNRNIMTSRLREELSDSMDAAHLFLSGHIKNIAQSSVRLTSTQNTFQGTIDFGVIDHPNLFIDSIQRYQEDAEDRRAVIYAFEDIRPAHKKQHLAHTPGRFGKRSLNKRSNQLTRDQLLAIVLNAVDSSIPSPLIVNSNASGSAAHSNAGSIALPNPTTQPQPAAVSNQTPPRIVTEIKQIPPIIAAAVPIPAQQPLIPQPNSQISGNSCKAAIIADKSFAAAHANEPGGVKAYLIGLMNEVSGFYEKQFQIPITLDSVIVDTDGTLIGNVPRDPSTIIAFVNNAAEKVVRTENFCVVKLMTSVKFDGNAVGVGFVGTICTGGSNTAVVTDNENSIPRAQVLSIMTHELGHVFGSKHDGDNNVCGREVANDRFVMFPSVQADSANTFVFSQCSVEQINDNLKLSGHTCATGNAARNGQPPQAATDSLGEPAMIIDRFF